MKTSSEHIFQTGNPRILAADKNLVDAIGLCEALILQQVDAWMRLGIAGHMATEPPETFTRICAVDYKGAMWARIHDDNLDDFGIATEQVRAVRDSLIAEGLLLTEIEADF